MPRAQDAIRKRILAVHRRTTLWAVIATTPLAVLGTMHLDPCGSYPPPNLVGAEIPAEPTGMAGRGGAWMVQ
jgi:hypothetical protein